MKWWRRKAREQELARELRSHLEAEAAEQRERGVEAEEARYAARRAFGNTALVSEDVREAWGWIWLERLAQDVRYGLRSMRKNPGFTATAVLSLALGIGANSAIFGMIDALILRSLPVHKPNELVEVMWNLGGHQSASFSYPVVEALAEHTELFEGVCGFSGATFVVGSGDSLERTPGAWAAAAYYETLGLVPQVGRLLSANDDKPGAPLVAVISDDYWARKYNRNPDAVGQPLAIQGQVVTIVGVSPPGFTGLTVGETNDITIPLNGIVPLSRNSGDRSMMLQAGSQWLRVLARPKEGVTREQIRERLRVLWPKMAEVALHPSADARRRKAVIASSLEIVPGATGWSALRSQFRTPLYVLMGVVTLVLLIACVNIANLLLARATARQREIAVRLALGASRLRIIRQLLTESFLLAMFGSAAGIVISRVGSGILLTMVSSGQKRIPIDLSFNWHVLGFTTAVGVATGILFGLAPALRATASGPAPALKDDTRTGSVARSRLAAALVSLQLAFSLLLVIAATLFVRTLMNLKYLDPGFRHEGVLLVNLDGRRLGYRDSSLISFYRELLESVRQQHGVTSVSFSNNTPVSGGYWSQDISLGDSGNGEGVHFNSVSPGYFETLKTPLLLGRDFRWQDDANAPSVVIVNQAFARHYFPDGHPLGRRFSVAASKFYQDVEIVGVVKDAVSYDLHQPPPPMAYVPFLQNPSQRLGSASFEIYAAGSLSEVSAEVQQLMRSRMPAAEFQMRTLTQQVENSIRQERLLAKLGGFFGVLALALAAIGLYGLLAYMVVRRTGEIGIRMALGAQHGQILRMVLSDALRLVLIGVLVGLPVAWWASRFIEKLMFGLRANDVATLLGAAGSLSAVAIVAALVPAHRAAHVDPMVALRYE
jgi:putative ABC transport system permease protein